MIFFILVFLAVIVSFVGGFLCGCWLADDDEEVVSCSQTSP